MFLFGHAQHLSHWADCAQAADQALPEHQLRCWIEMAAFEALLCLIQFWKQHLRAQLELAEKYRAYLCSSLLCGMGGDAAQSGSCE